MATSTEGGPQAILHRRADARPGRGARQRPGASGTGFRHARRQALKKAPLGATLAGLSLRRG